MSAVGLISRRWSKETLLGSAGSSSPKPTYALHSKSVVSLSPNTLLVALIEGRPATTRVELGLGRVQGITTTLADEVPLIREKLVVFSSSCGLSPLLAQHLKGSSVKLDVGEEIWGRKELIILIGWAQGMLFRLPRTFALLCMDRSSHTTTRRVWGNSGGRRSSPPATIPTVYIQLSYYSPPSSSQRRTFPHGRQP